MRNLTIQLIQKRLSVENTKSKFQNTKYKIKILWWASNVNISLGNILLSRKYLLVKYKLNLVYLYLLASYYEFVNTIRRVQTYLKGNSWSMFWETFLDPITFREIRKHNHILISMNEIRTPPWQQTNDWLTARKTKPYVMANDDVAKRQHIFLASLFARCYRSRYWKFEFTGLISWLCGSGTV